MQFASLEEEAEFWDTHDLTDFFEFDSPVELVFAENLWESITIPLDDEALAKLQAIAKELDTDPTALVLAWVLERLGVDWRAQREASVDGIQPELVES
jgi:hypothetical protein